MFRFSRTAVATVSRSAATVPSRALSTGVTAHPTADAEHTIAVAQAAYAKIPRKKFDPTKIYPWKAGSVRICNNTTRDAQQSNLSAEMAAIHRIQIATLIDDCYKDMTGPTGVEQIWGGTIPMFDIWKRGVHPFDSLREMTRMLPNTPTSMLVRSNSLNSMNSQPKDVVDSFIKNSVAAGVNVFTNFDANNDPRNHVAVAEAVHKYGEHYQAALSWAVVHSDPTIYNVQWAVNWFKRIVKDLAPHSLYVKDPSGVLTPEMAGLLAREIKAEFPNLPLIYHSHYQTGFAYAAYLEAMKNGANGVECSLGFPDGAGQPYSLSMLRMVEDYGLETGNPNKQKWHQINMLCKNTLRPLYASANVVRTPDIQVEQTGIAGGQRSILDKELIDANQAHLIPRVDEMVQQVRKEGGLVCQVTPAADSYAREAMRRIRGGSDAKGFTPGYAQILYGENGSTKEPVNVAQKRAALDERVVKKVNEMVAEKKLSRHVADIVLGFDTANKKDLLPKHERTPLALWRHRMDELSEPVIQQQRREEVQARLGELEAISKKPDVLKSLNIKVNMAAEHAKEGTVERSIKTVQDRMKILQAELAELKKSDKGTAQVDTDKYHNILLGKAADAEYAAFAALSPHSAKIFKDGSLTVSHIKEILSHAGTITCSSSLLLTNSMEQSRREIEAFDEQHCLGLLDTPQKAEENTLLWACFSKAAIPNLIQNFFLHYYTGDITGFFPKLFKGDKEDGRTGTLKKRLAKDEAKNQFLYRHIHQLIETIIKQTKGAAATVSKVKELQHQAQLLEYRSEKWSDSSVESSRVTDATKQKLKAKIAALRAEAATGQESLNEVVKAYLTAHPGLLRPSYPVFDQVQGAIEYTTDAKIPSPKGPQPTPFEVEYGLAKEALNQIIHHK